MRRFVLLLFCALLGASGCCCFGWKKDVKAWAENMARWAMEYREYDHNEQRADELAMCEVVAVLEELIDKSTLSSSDKAAFRDALNDKTPYCPPTDTHEGPRPPPDSGPVGEVETRRRGGGRK